MLASAAPTLYQARHHWTLVVLILCHLCSCTQNKARTQMQRWTGTIGKGGELTLQQINVLLLKLQNKNAAWIQNKNAAWIIVLLKRISQFQRESTMI
ncbi:hypothetical protein JOQ06_004566 [Pogonophryne albipinna]|uniref:Secreted protein n=1 Tax=Pogonophryne albipinna TaxID=1090488 RepID=A0AAD6AQC5_9TELE|nr:hypothetical protein JOQ06_004566 [Pogonophryne albipinna]